MEEAHVISGLPSFSRYSRNQFDTLYGDGLKSSLFSHAEREKVKIERLAAPIFLRNKLLVREEEEE